jgi:hypothetical protein
VLCALLTCRAVVVAVEFRAIAGFALVERGGPGGASLSAILVVDRSTVVAGRWLGRDRLRFRTGTRVDAAGCGGWSSCTDIGRVGGSATATARARWASEP